MKISSESFKIPMLRIKHEEYKNWEFITLDDKLKINYHNRIILIFKVRILIYEYILYINFKVHLEHWKEDDDSFWGEDL